MNGRSLASPHTRWRRGSWEAVYQNVSAEFVEEKMPSFLSQYLHPAPGPAPPQLPQSHDWTDSAGYSTDIRGPFSGVLGWNNLGSASLARRLSQYVHNKRLLIDMFHHLFTAYKDLEKKCQ